MKLGLSEVQHVARLARLELSAAEELQLLGQLTAILEAVDVLSSVNTDGVLPTTFAIGSTSHSRPDEVKDELTVEQALANAPRAEAGSFALPRVIE